MTTILSILSFFLGFAVGVWSLAEFMKNGYDK